MRCLVLPCAVLAASLLARTVPAAEPLTVTVSAGKLDRADTVVTFTLPQGDWTGDYHLRDANGAYPLLIAPDRRATFVLDALPAGQSRAFTLTKGLLKTIPVNAIPIEAQRKDGVVRISSGNKLVLQYQGDKSPLPQGYTPEFQRGGYIHPVQTPSGVLVTDDYPPKHKHHHGIWAPWTKTQFEGRTPDFWNMGTKTGTVEFVALEGPWSSGAAVMFQARHRFLDLSAKPEPKAVLNEQWDVTVYPMGMTKRAWPYFLFDLAIRQDCATDQPLVLPKYHYGGLGIRGHRQWDQDATNRDPGPNPVNFLTSEGRTRKDGNESRGKWAHMGGKVDGKDAGIAVFDHPSNFRHPGSLRLHPNEPFLCYAPQQQGDFAIEPGKPYTARYRFVVMDGPADKAVLEQLWTDYANPVEVMVK